MKVSQAPAVSEVLAAVVPPVGGTAMATLPSAVLAVDAQSLGITG